MTKSWTELLGVPHHADCVVGSEIVRTTNYFTLGDFGVRRPIFEILWKFDSNEKASEVFNEWTEENKWIYTKPILGTDENGQPIMIDSWGKDNNPLKGHQNAVDITRATELQKEKD